MTPILEVEHLCKTYSGFSLRDIAFSVGAGRIVGFIGRNGAGKTTVLKSLLHFVAPDGGSIRFFDRDFTESERDIKEKTGFVSGGIQFYPKKKLRAIAEVTSRFYPNWDASAYREYLRRFSLDEEKTPDMLSEGMKVKFSLALALSHHAKLLILDEPTSGLDPVSREDLLDEFLALQKEGVGILFSTHITSDLEKCADDIVYISNGRILASDTLENLKAAYRVASFQTLEQARLFPGRLIGLKEGKRGCSALVSAADARQSGMQTAPADLEQIMIYLDKGYDFENTAL